jgi:hypothetical protein
MSKSTSIRVSKPNQRTLLLVDESKCLDFTPIDARRYVLTYTVPDLFYKGVDKSRVHEARLTQSTAEIDVEVNVDADVAQGKGAKASGATSEPTPEGESKNGEAPPPGSSTTGPSVPYPFTSGASLLALTRKHNVRMPSPYPNQIRCMDITALEHIRMETK